MNIGNRVSISCSLALLLACGCSISSALAEEPRTETVKFGDLTLSTPSGVQTLYSRIHAAAHRVCSETDPLQRMAEAACARHAEEQAIAAINVPQLTAYSRAKRGEPLPLLVAKH